VKRQAAVCNIVGGALSPLLSNILLDELDQELKRRGHRFVRYADDCNIYVRSRRSGERVLASVERFLKDRLRLTVNRQKSAVDRPWNRKFLGYTFTMHFQPKLKVARITFEDLDQWIRRKLRAILWRQWKRPWTRAKALMRRGLDPARAWTSATNGRGPWWNAGASHMNQAIPTRSLHQLGLVSLLQELKRLEHST
jgi:RNA-directed DNA polymerase